MCVCVCGSEQGYRQRLEPLSAVRRAVNKATYKGWNPLPSVLGTEELDYIYIYIS